MLEFKKGITAEDIINDGEYNDAVKAHIKNEVQYSDKHLLNIYKEWSEELEEMGETELLAQFDELDETEAIRWMDVDEVLDYYEEKGELKDFAHNLNIDWRGLEESFGVE